ncbi:hypothetical protein HGO37_03665 [Rhizobium sp. CG4]|jgi:hypothetical protein|uniref:hypothetical protein n=1 Tax=Rhizobium sp. CG4 TaxID=2726075 RepID=UPI002033D395|nr:hypothetical protein [Rhizobium sp. CG4]MCM2454477.1 hypothetical protein [Rhizobium sp. CG4]
MVKLIRFTKTTASAGPVLINPEAVAAVTEVSGKTTIYLKAPDVNAHGLQFKVREDIETVAAALMQAE